MMHIKHLANELLIQIFQSCDSVRDVLNLAAANRHFHRVFTRCNRLSLLFSVAEVQYGPLDDATQVVTYNSSQAAHIYRQTPQSIALLKQLIDLGKTANRWTDIYPMTKWKTDYESRRLLSVIERWRLRRALYRLWLYSRAFHNRQHTRYGRMQRQVVLERAKLLHNWTSDELAEIQDLREVIREVLQSQICPSNGTIQRQFKKRHPESDHQLLFNIHLNYPPPASDFQNRFHSAHQINASARAASAMKFTASPWHEPGGEGWGDEVPHYYVVEDMLKLDPAQILWLTDNAPLKGMVEAYVKDLGEWFENNGESFGQTMEWVIRDRGEDIDKLREAVIDRELGIVKV